MLKCPRCDYTAIWRSRLLRHLFQDHKVLNPGPLVPLEEEKPLPEVYLTDFPPKHICVMCNKVKPVEDFGSVKRGLTCLACRAHLRLMPNADPALKAAAHRQQIKKAVLRAYGNKCSCCGEVEALFLCIDHEQGAGGVHLRYLRQMGKGSVYSWLILMNFPEGFRVLCCNCNHACAINGICPHQNTKSEPRISGAEPAGP